MNDAELSHLLQKCRDAAAGGWSVQSTGEKLAAALVLNRPDWLASMDYTIPEAIERVGPAWMALVPHVARILRDEARG
ncbi:MAG: hypothetical protein ACTHOK_03495 [Nocardioidaceae bacterium]